MIAKRLPISGRHASHCRPIVALMDAARSRSGCARFPPATTAIDGAASDGAASDGFTRTADASTKRSGPFSGECRWPLSPRGLKLTAFERPGSVTARILPGARGERAPRALYRGERRSFLLDPASIFPRTTIARGEQLTLRSVSQSIGRPSIAAAISHEIVRPSRTGPLSPRPIRLQTRFISVPPRRAHKTLAN